MERPAQAETSIEKSPLPQLPSVFPIANASAATASAPAATASAPAAPTGWLYNPSFKVDLSTVNDASSSHHSPTNLKFTDEDEEDDNEKEEQPKPTTRYELVESSGSEAEEREEKRRSKKKRKKRKKGGKDEGTPFDYASRKSGVRAWANSETRPSKDYYYDSNGDPDNLAFGCLYRIDVARYKLYNSGKSLQHNVQFEAYSWSKRRSLDLYAELDIDALDTTLKSSGRYWSAKYSALERHKDLKRIRVLAPEKPDQVVLDSFIPLMDHHDESSGGSSGLGKAVVIEESWEDEVLRKTKEFNRMTRENPRSVRMWLDFAEFQDQVASRQPQKGARLQTLEKKISILEKATELNPDDDDLLLSLLKAYQGRDSTDILIGRWEKILLQHPDNCKLWREFLRVVQGQFSTFKVSEQRKMYAHAIQALSAASSKRKKQVWPGSGLSTEDASVSELELGIVDLFLGLCRFEWQAGYRELATALFQAEIEYGLFSPTLQLTEQSKRRLFEHFWNSDGARIGEDGALGWSTWLEKEEENRQKVMSEMSSKEEERDGWTGWFVPPSKNMEDFTRAGSTADASAALEDTEEETGNEDVKQEDDEDDALMKMLGINIDTEASGEVKDSTTWARWSEEECLRDQDQWMPLRAKSGISPSAETMDGEGEEQLSRVILFEDVSEFLFSLSSSQAKLSLVSQFIDFFGGEIQQCVCTNSSSWTEKVLSLEELPDSILQDLRRVHNVLMKAGCISTGFSLEILLHCQKNNSRTDVMKFLRNAILLCLTVFPRNYNLEEAVLIAEEKYIIGSDSSLLTATPCQALAKRLLKSDRQDLLLCGVYARREAAFGNMEQARKVFDMALSSANGLPSQGQAPLLYLWYAEMELANSSDSGSDSSSRILHILSCLGSGIAYAPCKSQPPSMQLLRAHQGYKERIKTVKSAWACGSVDHSSVALVCSAALFEELTIGWAAGVKVLAEALAMVLPEAKSRSYQLEYLFTYCLKMFQKHHKQARLSKVMHCISQGLQIYPYNPQLFQSLVEVSHLYIVPNKLRQIFDDHYQKKASAILLLFALSFELSRGDMQHRIHGLFEKALTDDRLRTFVVLWRCYIAYEIDVVGNLSSAKRIFFRAIHACPWSKKLWLDGFLKLNGILTAKELSDLQEVMRDKELNLRTDIYEILLQQDLNLG
ncbi:hypothetical protein Ancab_000179 [Ancistrocladus abbreviatus]